MSADSPSDSARVASSYSTGGGGVTFERRVAVRYLTAMLAGVARTEAEGWRVTQVAFQQGPAGPVDDIHVRMARDGEEAESLELWVAVRRRPSFVRSDADTAKLIDSFVTALGEPREPGVERRLVVAVAGHQPGAAELAELAELARKMDEAAFAVEMAADGRPRKALKNRYHHVRDLVATSLPPGHDTSKVTWQLLQKFYVSMPRLESPDEADWTALLAELESWAREQSAAGADALRSKLESLAAGYDPAAAVVSGRSSFATRMRRSGSSAVRKLRHGRSYVDWIEKLATAFGWSAAQTASTSRETKPQQRLRRPSNWLRS